jgi:hypothetical protein
MLCAQRSYAAALSRLQNFLDFRRVASVAREKERN